MNERGENPQGLPPTCRFCVFGLIVTGEAEAEFLPQFFRSLMNRAGCTFRVLRKTGQRPPISEGRRLKMVGRGQAILPKDEEEIGLEARRFLRNRPCNFVILIDDLEYDRRPVLAQVFNRYRAVLDTMLLPEEKLRAAVHFLANMLEAYYFADSQAVNQALGAIVLSANSSGDVEEIRHPKADVKRLHPGFDEKADGAKIVSALDLDRVLDTPETCAFLRSLFGWCVRQLRRNCPVHDPALHTRYQLPAGSQAELTRGQ
jgi:hypothetical protein